jgi:hypothetical protein
MAEGLNPGGAMDEHQYDRAGRFNPTLQLLRWGILGVLLVIAAIIAVHYFYDLAGFRCGRKA